MKGSRVFPPVLARVLLAALLPMLFSARASAQGGEPRSFAIRDAKVVPVSGPPLDGATIVISKGLIVAVGKDVTYPS